MAQRAFIGSGRTKRRTADMAFRGLCLLAAMIVVFCLGFLLWQIFRDGIGGLTREFFTQFSSRIPSRAGIRASLVGSLWVMGLTVAMAVPIGVAAAVYLEEFADKRSRIVNLVKLNISNLAGVPSIVYGLLGLSVFVYMFSMGRSLLAAACTISILILPMIILVSQEALRAVPTPFREGALAIGATPWQAVRTQILPVALPGITTGVILSISRAIGETAPLIVVGAVTSMFKVPDDLSGRFTVLPIQIFDWSSRPQKGFHEIAASASIVLLGTLLVMNLIAVVIRARYEKRL